MAVVDWKGRRVLGPVTYPRRWILAGLGLQIVGAGGPASFLLVKVRHQDVGGHITAATVKLLWHNEAHTTAGIALLAVGAVLFAAGSVLMARPYVRRPVTLLVAVPLAAVAGMLVLGVIALIAAMAIAAAENFDLSGASDALDLADRSHRGVKRLRRRFGQPPP